MTIEEKVQEVLNLIRLRMNADVADAMRRENIIYSLNYGVSIPELRELSARFQGDHELALRLFQEDIRECKLMASMIADPAMLTGEQIDDWSADLANPELVDHLCGNLFWKSEYSLARSIEWCLDEDELYQKAGLLIVAHRASIAGTKDSIFEPYIGIVENLVETGTEFITNAAVYALREIGQRSPILGEKVLEAAARMAESDSETAAWIGSQLLYEFREE